MRPALDLLRKRDNVFEKRGLVAAPVEVVEKRTERGKTFDLGGGYFHLSQSIGPVHYKDENGDWQEIDLSFRFVEAAEGAVWRMDKAAYICDVFTDRVGWRHTSREGWWRQCELVSVDGVPVVFDRLPRLGEANVVLYDGVTPDLDVKVVAYRLKSEKFHKPAKPMTLTWRVTASDGAGGTFQEKTRGWDKGGDTLEMVSALDGETFTETWTGRVSKVVDKRTRRKAWTTEPEYPVMVDASITENIVANVDDGHEGMTAYPFTQAVWASISGPYINAGGIEYTAERQPGFRFRTLALPAGATINAATLTLNIVVNVWGTPQLNLYGDKVTDAAMWSNGNLPTGITKTTAHVAVSPTATGTGYGINVQAVVSEIAALTGWASGNNLRFALINQVAGPATALFGIEDYVNAAGNEAQIDITYTAGATTKPFRRSLLGVGF